MKTFSRSSNKSSHLQRNQFYDSLHLQLASPKSRAIWPESMNLCKSKQMLLWTFSVKVVNNENIHFQKQQILRIKLFSSSKPHKLHIRFVAVQANDIFYFQKFSNSFRFITQWKLPAKSTRKNKKYFPFHPGRWFCSILLNPGANPSCQLRPTAMHRDINWNLEYSAERKSWFSIDFYFLIFSIFSAKTSKKTIW